MLVCSTIEVIISDVLLHSRVTTDVDNIIFLFDSISHFTIFKNFIHTYNIFWSMLTSMPPLTHSRSTAHPQTPSNFIALLFFKTPCFLFVLPISSWVWGHPLEHRWPVQGHTLEENWLSPSRKHKLEAVAQESQLSHAVTFTSFILSQHPQLLWVHGFQGPVIHRNHCLIPILPNFRLLHGLFSPVPLWSLSLALAVEGIIRDISVCLSITQMLILYNLTNCEFLN